MSLKAGQVQCITSQCRDQQQDLDTSRAARAMQVEGKAETQTFNIPETFLDLHPLAVDAHNLACGPVGFRQVAGEQPGLLFSASVLSTEFATRDAALHTSVFSTLG